MHKNREFVWKRTNQELLHVVSRRSSARINWQAGFSISQGVSEPRCCTETGCCSLLISNGLHKKIHHRGNRRIYPFPTADTASKVLAVSRE
ncbi:hypothetical protein KOW79_019392 [Hemibagrus wyckioides]|uniref:Uncharacterized protein n=1 Tax=Hemibagrus wyckioides TaxID=337641 RepID=A0A9D3N713_9TELE|nr:hypothetical protein KOW79_019392 [Hemibagrus wyckioides]